MTTTLKILAIQDLRSFGLVLGLLSVVAVGCGGGDSNGTGQSGSYNPCQEAQPPAYCTHGGGMEAAENALASGAATFREVVQPAVQMQQELEGTQGGVNSLGQLASAASAAGATGTDSTGLVGVSPSRAGTGGPEVGLSNPGINPPGGTGGEGGGESGGLSPTGGGGLEGGQGAPGGLAAGDSGGSTGEAGARNGSQSSAAIAGRSGGGGAVGGSGGGGGRGAFGELFGGGSNDSAGGSSQSVSFGHAGGEVNPFGSADPGDYFTRLGMDDNLFKIVERRYRNKAGAWARVDNDTVGRQPVSSSPR